MAGGSGQQRRLDGAGSDPRSWERVDKNDRWCPIKNNTNSLNHL